MPAFDSYREQWRAAYSTEAPPIALNMNMYCHPSAEIAGERAQTYIHRFFASNVRHYEFMGTHFKDIKGYERYDEVAAMFRQAGLEGAASAYAACALTGTPDQIVAKLAGIKEVLGSFEVTVLPSFGAMPYDQAEASLELFAKEVLPAARDILD
jgi:alkanesulfonate monooxygenase SsuD/methylene tetrahydromethanopterin reductase-like flavin-dependent oxidoreductase (luciferase family)